MAVINYTNRSSPVTTATCPPTTPSKQNVFGSDAINRADSLSNIFRRAEGIVPTDTFSDLKDKFSPLQRERATWEPVLPDALTGPVKVEEDPTVNPVVPDHEILAKLFPNTWGQKFVKLLPTPTGKEWASHTPLRLGCVLSGGQAAGGHNVIAGIYDYIKQCNPHSQLFGFKNGPAGIFKHNYVEVTDEYMDQFRNMGGFHMICSGRDKIETEEQKEKSMEICNKLQLDGLVVIGGDDSNTNAAILAEYMKGHGCGTKVVGCPKTIDGDLKNEYVECSFGFDTACKTYSELIGNLCVDVATSRARYHFIRVMGRSASNIALECALQTRANLCFVGEEIERDKRSLKSIVDEVVDMIIKRAELKKFYGIVILPEGLIEFIPEIGKLISEINDIVAQGPFDKSKLSQESHEVFVELPTTIADTLLLDRDPHGNVQVSKIATELLIIQMAEMELQKRGKAETIKFCHTSHFFGYEGRCALPSNFDANYCYALGHTAGALVDNGMTGYMAVVRQLKEAPTDWIPAGCPITVMMNIERRKGKEIPVIKKYLVDLNGPLFVSFAKVRDQWKYQDLYRNPGPIQLQGPTANLVNYLVSPPSMSELLPEVPKNTKAVFPRSLSVMSPLQVERLKHKVDVASVLKKTKARCIGGKTLRFSDQQTQKFVRRAFPLQSDTHQLKGYYVDVDDGAVVSSSMRLGVYLGGQSVPGAMNVVEGLFERCQMIGGTLIGFKGITGLLENQHIVIERDDISLYINQGGFELLGRTAETKVKLRTEEGIAAVAKVCTELKLDGLIAIGGQTTLTDAALIAEHFLATGVNTKVIGVPANQENNLNHPMIETTIGFDSCSKCYATLIGNLLTDAASASKYWYFVRLMGMTPSCVVQEAALQTHPNFVVIGEKYNQNNMTMREIVTDIADAVCARAADGKNFGTVLIPEGLVVQLPKLKDLVRAVDALITSTPQADLPALRQEIVDLKTDRFASRLEPWCSALLKTMPEFFRAQLVKQTPSGRVELSELGSEQFVAELVALELKDRKAKGTYKGNFASLCHYFGFQGRSAMPSLFDCSLGVAHGYLAGILVESGLTGYLTSVRNLCAPYHAWKMSAVPITALMRIMPEDEMKAYGRNCPMIPPGEVDLNGQAFKALTENSSAWEMEDLSCNPGPIQYYGKCSKSFNRSLYEEQFEYMSMIEQLEGLTAYVNDACAFGVDKDDLKTAVVSLKGLASILSSKKRGYY